MYNNMNNYEFVGGVRGRGRGPNNKGAGRSQPSLGEGGGRSTYLQTPVMCMGQPFLFPWPPPSLKLVWYLSPPFLLGPLPHPSSQILHKMTLSLSMSIQFEKFSSKTAFVTIFSKCLEIGNNFLKIFAYQSVNVNASQWRLHILYR